jgi:hypothetical protein
MKQRSPLLWGAVQSFSDCLQFHPQVLSKRRKGVKMAAFLSASWFTLNGLI